MTINEAMMWLKSELMSITDEWDTEMKWMLCHVLDCSTLDLVLYKNQVIDETCRNLLVKMLERRKKREPIQYILGAHEFMGLPFHVESGVLIPRQDTESLVDYLLKHIGNQAKKVLDIGTGSGAIAVAIAKLSPHTEVTTVDISKEALAIAAENVKMNGVADRVKLIESDLFSAVQGEKFDIIVSNPPYIPEGDKAELMPEVANYEPGIALFGGIDGLDYYRRIIPTALEQLYPKGLLIFEAGHDQAKSIVAIFEHHGYEDVGVFSDLRGVPRFIYGYKPQ